MTSLIFNYSLLSALLSVHNTEYEVGSFLNALTILSFPNTTVTTLIAGPVSYTHLDVYKRQT